MSHTCRHCGASCQGLRVRVHDDERAGIDAHAVSLGVQRPFSGPYLRQNWGTCVFYEAGCRLHRAYGADAKPAACRAFPERTGIDPACFHPGEHASTELWDHWDTLDEGFRVRARIRALPLDSVRKPTLIGSTAADALQGLDDAEPLAPDTWRGRLDWRAKQALPDVAHQGNPVGLLVGGAQLLCGLGRPQAFAAWVRLLRALPDLGG